MKSRNGLILAMASLLFVSVTTADPVPYPNIGGGSSDTKSVKIKGDKTDASRFANSKGDEGSSKGVVSSKNKSSTFISPGSLNVKVEGKGIVR